MHGLGCISFIKLSYTTELKIHNVVLILTDVIRNI